MTQKGGGYHCLHENKYRMKLSFQIHSSSRGMGIIFVSKLDTDDLDFCIRLSILSLSKVILFHLLIRQPPTMGRTTLRNVCRVDQ